MGEYEDTLEDIDRTLGIIPGFMKVFPEESLIHDWPSWKKDAIGEIDMERARYLLNTDEMIEEMLDEGSHRIKAGFGRKARTVCCGVLVDTDMAPMARTSTGEQFLVCNDDCRKIIETATPEQIKGISAMKLQSGKGLA